MLGEVVLADTVMAVDLEDDQFVGSDSLPVARCQGIAGHRLVINVSPEVDDRQASALRRLGQCCPAGGNCRITQARLRAGEGVAAVDEMRRLPSLPAVERML